MRNLPSFIQSNTWHYVHIYIQSHLTQYLHYGTMGHHHYWTENGQTDGNHDLCRVDGPARESSCASEPSQLLKWFETKWHIRTEARFGQISLEPTHLVMWVETSLTLNNLFLHQWRPVHVGHVCFVYCNGDPGKQGHSCNCYLLLESSDINHLGICLSLLRSKFAATFFAQLVQELFVHEFTVVATRIGLQQNTQRFCMDFDSNGPVFLCTKPCIFLFQMLSWAWSNPVS